MEGAYYKTKESVEEYIHLAKDVNGQSLIDKLEQVLPKDAKVLELGSGPGTDWNILNQTYHVVGSDNSSEFLNHLKQAHPTGEFLDLDAITLDTTKQFDGIYSNKVLHHLKDDELVKSLKRQYDILTTDGIICHSFWKGEGSEVFKGLFVNYHDEEHLRTLFGSYFTILSIETYAEFEDGDSLLVLGQKK